MSAAAYRLLALAVLVLAAVPVGVAAFVLGFVYGDSPCVLCWEQRTGMIVVALIGLFVLRYGARPKYVGLAVIVGAWGMYAGLRHTASHAWRDIGQGFSVEIFHAHTYAWSFLIFWVCVIALGVLLMMLQAPDLAAGATRPRALLPLDRLAFVVFVVVVAANIVQAFASTGPPPFMGQSDPVRFSFNPRHWVWSTDEWRAPAISWRGRWGAEKPHLDGLPVDPAAGPLTNLPMLKPARQIRLTLPLNGTPTGLAYDAASDRFAISTEHGIYIVNSRLDGILRYTIVDPGYSVDLARFGGVAFLDSSTVIAVSENKSYVVLRENDRPDVSKNFRFFLESFDKFDELSRSRFATVRARMMYTRSIAYDPGSSSLYSISVPNSRTRQLVVSRFDRRDMTLSEESRPILEPRSGLTFAGEKRSLDEYYVTAATFAEGSLVALSAAYNTVLIFNPGGGRTIDTAYGMPGLVRPAGIAIKGTEFHVLGEEGMVSIFQLRSNSIGKLRN